jgi:hypothetical protein
MQFHSRECYQQAMKTGHVHDLIVSKLTSESFKQKRLTMLKRYGVTTSAALPHVQQKARQTCMDRYGSPSSMGDPAVRAKKEATFIEHYGTSVPIAFHPETVSKACRKMSCFRVLEHWKTHEKLNCRGSYEVAFVTWCNLNQIDFDWQISHSMPDGHIYIVDAFIKSGEHIDKWVEIKGYMREKGRQKWEWFQKQYQNTELWNRVKLIELGVLKRAV